MKTPEKPLLGLYIHWPYCLSKCPYCDFASAVCHAVDEKALFEGYARDLARTPETQDRALTSIFFGGGTPSLMSPAFLEKLLNLIGQKYTFSEDMEVSMEVNPDAIDSAKMRDFKSLGVNRLSVGVQALNEQDLRQLGRRHSVQTALRCLENAQKVFARVNMDLIYARPNQTLNSWEEELRTALDLGLAHYSLYQLTLEQGTVFYKTQPAIPNEELAADLYELTDAVMKQAGVPAYEVSNYARVGQECRHNLVYWTGGDYIGIGPAAHGRIGLMASENERAVQKWLKTPTTYTALTDKERFEERVLMGLRLTRHGFLVQGLSERGIEKALSYGWITRSEDTIMPTVAGTLMLNELIATVLP